MSLSLVSLCQRALRERAMFQVPGTIIGNDDVTAIRLNMAADRTGRSLAKLGGWQRLQLTATITTIAGQASYDLPAGFLRIIGITQWNRSNNNPLVGPLTATEWQALVAGNMVTSDAVQYWRIRQNDFIIQPAPDAVETITYEYVSRNWVINISEMEPTKEYFSTDGDTCVFDDDIMVMGIKERYQAIVLGVDFTPSAEYSAIIGVGVSGDAGTPVVDYRARPTSTVNLPGNIPEGSW